jgi:arylsulfatase
MLFLLVNASCQKNTSPNLRSENAPNILLLVADDLGYTDLGCYGGEIPTPNIDQLAASGIRFTRFFTAPMCAPTRAMLLTGNDNHIAGMGRQAMEVPVFGYEGHLTDRVVALPELLKSIGYHTYIAGKWHLGHEPAHNPHSKGFDESFVLLEGVGNHFNPQGMFGGGSKSAYTKNGIMAEWPQGGYSTDVYTDALLANIKAQAKDGKPFFAYAAYTAPHWPLQAPQADWKPFKGNYDDGYEVLRENRFKKAVELGLIPNDATLPVLHPGIISWDSLTLMEKKIESRKMEIYAGMVSNLDRNIGRLLEYLKSNGHYENTLVIFMSDNGAAGDDYFRHPEIRPYINPYYTDDYDSMGRPESFISYGPPWAEASSAPFRYYKEYTTNGGILAPLIVSGEFLPEGTGMTSDMVTVMDLAPTIYEFAGIDYPQYWGEKKVYPLKGNSIVPFLLNGNRPVHSEDYVFAMEHTGNRMLLKGNWKIVASSESGGPDDFSLFQMTTDIGESNDLRYLRPDKYQELIQAWEEFAEEIRLPRE